MYPIPLVKCDIPLTDAYSNGGVDNKCRLIVPATFVKIFMKRQAERKKRDVVIYYRVEGEIGPNRLYLTDFLKSTDGFNVLNGFKYTQIEEEGRIQLKRGIFEVGMSEDKKPLTFVGVGNGIVVGPSELTIEQLVMDYNPKKYHP